MIAPCPRCGRVDCGINIVAAFQEEQADLAVCLAAVRGGMPLEQAISAAYAKGYQRRGEHEQAQRERSGC